MPALKFSLYFFESLYQIIFLTCIVFLKGTLTAIQMISNSKSSSKWIPHALGVCDIHNIGNTFRGGVLDKGPGGCATQLQRIFIKGDQTSLRCNHLCEAAMAIYKFLIATALYLTLLHLIAGHSFLLEPRTEASNPRECRVGGPDKDGANNCRGPCISESWQLKKIIPVTTYKRGEKFTAVWAMNNHAGGFVRFTLVPIKDRMNKKVHDKFAFHYTCYKKELHKCPYFGTSNDDYCGTAEYLYRTNLTVPKVYPNGEYILGWSWYGGVEQKKAYYGDYWSCARIKINGGPFEDSFAPEFSPENGKGCNSPVNELGVCPSEPCNSNLPKPSISLPKGFKKSGKGKFVTSASIDRSALDSNYRRASPTSDPSPTPSRTPSISASPTPTPSSKHVSPATPSFIPDRTPVVKPSARPKPETLQSKITPSLNSGNAEIEALSVLEIFRGRIRVITDFADPIRATNYDSLTLEAKTSGEFLRVEFYIDGVLINVEYSPSRSTGASASKNRGQFYSSRINPPINKRVDLVVKGYVRDGSFKIKTASVKFVS